MQVNRLARPASRVLSTHQTGRAWPARRSFAWASVRAQAQGAAGPNPDEGQGQQSGKRKRADKAAEEEQGAPVGTTPWARFVEVLKAEYQKSREFQASFHSLTGGVLGPS